jgi:hypothetical protein
MLPEPNFPARPDEFVGRKAQIAVFRQALQQGQSTGRSSSFAILGEWGIGKSSLLLKFATVCSEVNFTMLPVFIPASKDVHDYLRFPESLLDKFTDALLAVPKMQARLRAELRNWIQTRKSRWLRSGTRVTAVIPQLWEFPPQTYIEGGLGPFLAPRTIQRRNLLFG